jgi:hypothetical protein
MMYVGKDINPRVIFTFLLASGKGYEISVKPTEIQSWADLSGGRNDKLRMTETRQ